MTEILGKRLQTRLIVLEELIRELDRKYKGKDEKFLREYIREHKQIFTDSSDAKREEILNCFIELRDRE